MLAEISTLDTKYNETRLCTVKSNLLLKVYIACEYKDG